MAVVSYIIALNIKEMVFFHMPANQSDRMMIVRWRIVPREF